jgi:hypothetical protein
MKNYNSAPKVRMEAANAPLELEQVGSKSISLLQLGHVSS